MLTKKLHTKRRTISYNSFLGLLGVALVLLLICIILSVVLFGRSTSDSGLSSIFIEQVQTQEGLAREAASMISRTGGSNTMQMLATTRQHLYAISLLNSLSQSILDEKQGLVPQAQIDAAIEQLDTSESRLQIGQAIDQQINTLWEHLMAIAQAASDL